MDLLIPILRKLQLPILHNCRNSRVLINSFPCCFWESGPHPRCLWPHPQVCSSSIHAASAQVTHCSAANHLLQFLESISLQLLLPTPDLLLPKQMQRLSSFNSLMTLLSPAATFRKDISQSSGKWKEASQHQEHFKVVLVVATHSPDTPPHLL